MISSQVEMLLIGAAIALLSSLITTVISSLLSHFLQRKIKNEERISRLHFLTGKVSAKLSKTGEVTNSWLEQMEKTNNFVNAVLKHGDYGALSGMEGLMEGLEEKRSELENQAKALEKELIELREKALALEKKKGRLEAGEEIVSR